MRYAQTTKQVTFNEAISLVRGIPRSRLAMGYSYICLLYTSPSPRD